MVKFLANHRVSLLQGFNARMFSWASGGIRSCWLKVAKATSEKRRLRWVLAGLRRFFFGVQSLFNHRVILLSCLNFIGFRGYPGVPIITHFACGQVPCKSQGVLALGFQCPYVFAGIWGYPFLLV